MIASKHESQIAVEVNVILRAVVSIKPAAVRYDIAAAGAFAHPDRHHRDRSHKIAHAVPAERLRRRRGARTAARMAEAPADEPVSARRPLSTLARRARDDLVREPEVQSPSHGGLGAVPRLAFSGVAAQRQLVARQRGLDSVAGVRQPDPVYQTRHVVQRFGEPARRVDLGEKVLWMIGAEDHGPAAVRRRARRARRA